MAQTPEWSLRDYVETVWTHRDGIPLASPNDFIQTSDGYLWFMSQGSLIRFDGVRFVAVPLPCDWVTDVESGEDGSLWLSCREPRIQVFRRDRNGRMTEVPLTGVAFKLWANLFRDRRGRLWIYSNVIARLEADGTLVQIPGVVDELPVGMTEDASGVLWLAAFKKVIRIRDDRAEFLPIGQIHGFAPAPSGGVFACGGDNRIWHLDGTSETLVARPPPAIVFMAARKCLGVDSIGTMWAGTLQHGIALIHHGRVETSLQGGPGGQFSGLFIDREDSVWFGTSTGLHRFRRPRARLLSSMGAVPPNPVAVFVDSRDDIWITGANQFVRLNQARGIREVFDRSHVTAFAEDDLGRIWLSTGQEIGRWEGGTFRPIRDAGGASVPNVFAFAKDGNGYLWVVSENSGIYQITSGPPRKAFDVPDAVADLLVSSEHGIWVTVGGGYVRQFLPGRPSILHDLRNGTTVNAVFAVVEYRGAVWACDHAGLWRWRNGSWTRWTREHGLPGAGGVHEIASDRLGRLWLMTSGGILVLEGSELDATPDGAPRPLRFVQIGALDRVVPHPGPPRTSPRVAMDGGGRLYFATTDAVAIVDPADVTPSSLRPTIALESVVVDNEPVDVATTGRLTSPSRLQFGYTSLSLRSPENIRFRYKLEGYDEDWVEAGNARQVTYGTLRPGSYRFHVIGSGSEGVWNDEGAAFAFQVVPVFYHAWWFRIAVVAMIGAGIMVTHRLRVRRLTQQLHLRFEERLAERTRIAQDLHDTLLQGTLAASLHVQVANEALADVPASMAVEDVRSPLQRAVQLLSQVAAEGRATVSGLRTAPVYGEIADTLHQAARSQPNHAAIDFRMVVDGTVRPLKPPVADEIVRIGREAVVNAYKHAQARRVEVELVYGSKLFTCIVRDDGRGIQQLVLERGREGHWGLTGMRERAERAGGELHVRSSANAGTEVELSISARLAYGEEARVTHSRWWFH